MVDVSPSQHPLLYRAIKSPKWFSVRRAAFRLRGPNPPLRPAAETDLSVILSAKCTKAVCDAKQGDCYGEFVLKTDAVIADGWRVTKDDPAGPRPRPNHASIHGLPRYGSDELLIQEAASRLEALIDSVQPRPST
jgi:hypothetical protein